MEGKMWGWRFPLIRVGISFLFVIICICLLGSSFALAQVRLQMAFVIDGSSSITGPNFILQKDGIAAAIENPSIVPPTGVIEILVVQFAGSSATLEEGPVVIDSQVKAAEVAGRIRQIEHRKGGTPTAAGIRRALAAMKSSPNFFVARKRVMNIATDGNPTGGCDEASQASDEAFASGINEIDLEGVGGLDEVCLKRMARPGPLEEVQLVDLRNEPANPDPTKFPKRGGFVVLLSQFEQFGPIFAQKFRPVAIVKADQAPCYRPSEQSAVGLDGSDSFDLFDKPLTYEWELVSKPQGSTVQLQNPTSANPTFKPDKGGEYKFKLVVSNGQVDSVSDEVTISVNIAPSADAGRDQTVYQGSEVNLVGTGSDPDPGDQSNLTLTWEVLTAPRGSFISPGDTFPGASVNFTVAIFGGYTLELIVEDDSGCPATDRVAIATRLPIGISITNLDLLFNELSHELYETLIAINNGRKLLNRIRTTPLASSISNDLIAPSSSVNLVEDSIDDAIAQVDLTVAKFAELQGLLDQLHEQLGDLLGTIQSMLEDPELTPAQSANLIKAKLKIESIELFTGELGNELESLQDRVDDGEPGEDPADDLKEVLEAAQEALAGDDLDGARAALNLAYQLTRIALRETKRLVRKKKLIIMSLVNAESALRRSTITSQSETVSTMPALRELGKNFAISEAAHNTIWFQALAANIKSLRLSVYTINGRLVFDREIPEAKLLFEGVNAQDRPLANGVYLIVLSAQSNDGTRTTNQVQKIVLKR